MSVPEPPWRLRSRPCPFYQQGRCIFAASCNFLHTAPSQSRPDAEMGSQHLDTTGFSSVDSTPVKPPLISVHSPQSVRSPPRSPRLASLLLALKDVLGDDPEDNIATELAKPDTIMTTENGSRSSGSATLVDGSPLVAHEAPLDNPPPLSPLLNKTEPLLHDQHSLVHNTQVYDNIDTNAERSSLQHSDTGLQSDTPAIRASTPFPHPAINARHNSTVSEDGIIQPSNSPHPNTRDSLLSSIGISHLNLTNFTRASMDMMDLIDDDTWRPPFPLALSPPRSPVPASTFKLLASPFGSPGARVLSPRLSAFFNRHSTATSSGETDTQSAHASDLDSPQRQPIPASTQISPASPPATTEDVFDIVADELEEFEADTASSEGDMIGFQLGGKGERNYTEGNEPEMAKEQEEPVLDNGAMGLEDSASSKIVPAVISTSSRPPTILHNSSPAEITHGTAANSLPQNIPQLKGTRDSTEWKSSLNQSSPGAEPLGVPFSLIPEAPADGQVPDKLSRPPTHSVPSESAIIPISETSESEDVDKHAERNLSARLAYLESNEGDQTGDRGSFISLYEAYSDFSPSPPREATISVEPPDDQSMDLAPGESSSISTPLSFIQDRVFTPSSMGARMDDDTPSLDSPLPSRRSFSVSRRASGLDSTFGVQPENRDVIEDIENVKSPTSSSRKVPFAWRNSLVSNRSNKTSRTSRTSRTTIRPVLDSFQSPPPADNPPSLSSSPSSPLPPNPPPRLRPLRLSVALNSHPQQPRSAPPLISAPPTHRPHQPQNRHVSTSTSSVLSNNRPSHNHSHSSGFSIMSDRMRNNLISSECRVPSPLTSDDFAQLANFGPPQSAPLSHSHMWRRASICSIVSQEEYLRPQSRDSQSGIVPIDEEEDDDYDEDGVIREQTLEYDDENVSGHSYRGISPSLPQPPHSAPVVQQGYRPFYHAVSTAKPTLMFAIASDDVAKVKRVLESGDAGPNDAVGPQTALEFALTNDQLLNKMEIVKTLLAYGADPRVVKQQPTSTTVARRRASSVVQSAASDVFETPVASLMDRIDPALKYYVERADAPHTRRTSALIHRSFFRPLTRVRYELVGQDCALEQLFKVLSIQSRGLSVAPTVVLLCGPSGHGKSLLARKFGSLLDVPTHTVNVTTLRSTHDLWQSHSMSPYEAPTTCTLAEFLINNEGKRCVVVLDEIEKTDEKTLWSLLMPWELGRCSFGTGNRHIDVRNVVWLGTSNIGHDLVFKHHQSRERPNELMTREEYVELMGLLRPLVSERLGASVLSRVTTVLPFVPFTLDEKKAICSEALYSLGGEDVRSLSSRAIESVIQNALGSYCPAEGARSLHRAISNQLIDII